MRNGDFGDDNGFTDVLLDIMDVHIPMAKIPFLPSQGRRKGVSWPSVPVAGTICTLPPHI